MSDAATLVARAKARHKVLTCTSCDLRTRCRRPVPFATPDQPDYTVLGEAPGRSEDRQGRPMVGPAGRQMRRMLRDAGLQPDAAGWTNIVACWPHGTPDQAHRDACQPNLVAQLDAIGSEHVVAAGSVALGALVPDAKLAAVHGCVIRVHDRWVLPVWHPAKVLREPDLRPVVVEALRRFTAVLLGADTLDYRMSRCVECGVTADLWDDREVGYCYRHRGLVGEWLKEASRKKKRESRRRKQENINQQPVLPLEVS